MKLAIDDTGRTYDEIAAKVSEYNKVLCIVNTRKDAKELYDRLPNDGVKLHLSRMMCPAHLHFIEGWVAADCQGNCNPTCGDWCGYRLSGCVPSRSRTRFCIASSGTVQSGRTKCHGTYICVQSGCREAKPLRFNG